jgi:hypothetical protein
MNGGARLTVEEQRVELIYRDVDVVRHWLDEADAGKYEVDRVEGYLAGMATYVLPGELAMAELLAGELPRPRFPDALRQAAPDAGGAAPASRSLSPKRRRGATMWSRARGCSPRRPSRLHRRRSPNAASGR